MRMEHCEHCGQPIIPDVYFNQTQMTIRRKGFDPVRLSPLQARLVEALAKAMPNAMHDDRTIMKIWPDEGRILSAEDTLKVMVCQINRKLKAGGMMIRRVAGFGYFLVCVDPPEAAAMEAMHAAEMIRDAIR
jgi:DNA-binding response OmpR family regulator